MSTRMGMILKTVPYKMQPNIITHLSYFYFFQRYQECHKQCDITTDAENDPHYLSLFKEQWTHNSFSRKITSETEFYKCWLFPSSAHQFSALHIQLFWLLVYQLKWNNASPVKTNCLTKNPFLYKKWCAKLYNYHETGNIQSWSKTVYLCWRIWKMSAVSIALEGQILVCLFQHLQISGLCLIWYTIHKKQHPG